MKEKELLKFWKKYIDIPLYRTVAGRDIRSVLKNGLDPGKNPYLSVRGKMRKLFRVVKKLERNGFVMLFNLGGKDSTGSYYVEMAAHELNRKMIDFTPVKEHYYYYKKLKGGAMVAMILRITEKLIEEKPKISVSDRELVKGLNAWAKKNLCDMKLIEVSGGCRCFEKAHFQLRKISKGKVRKNHKAIYYKSPFGSFENFKKVIGEEGLRKYSSRLRSQDYYVRVLDKIPAREVNLK
tara:strand:- start:46 stop:756 length:711 start_codon:yes stop_codon:yes gene_type:complete